MADLPQYTGATYNAEMYKLPNETMSEYMLRLAKLRSAGVLGGGGMLDTPAPAATIPVTAPALGQLTRNVNDGGVEAGIDTRTPREVFESAVRMKNYGLDKGQQIGLALTPFGGAIQGLAEKGLDTTIEGFIKSLPPDSPERKEAEAFLSAGYGPMQQVDDTSLLSSIGNPLSMFGSIVNGLFGTNTPEQQAMIPVVTSPGTPVNAATVYPVQPISVPTVTQGMLSPSATSSIAESVALTGGGEGTSSDPYSPSWSASDTSSWDTSGGGTNADGSYDISSWF